VGVPDFLTELVLLIAFAAAGVAVFERFRLPSIAGFLVTGAVVGPGGIGLVSDPEDVRTLAALEFGTRTGASVLAVDRGGATSANPPPSFAIRPGDRLLVFGGSEQVARARALLGIGAGRSP